jgi:hypothetical protein
LKNELVTHSSSSFSSFARIKRLVYSFLLSIRIVFSHILYVALAVAVATIFWVVFNIFEQLLFFSPVWVFYLPEDAILSFTLTNVTAVLLGILVSMNVYIIKHSRIKIGKPSSFFSGAGLSIISSTCVSCSSVGFLLISTFGGLGIVVSNILSIYQIPLRIISIGILIFALYSVHKRITNTCVIEYHNNVKETDG